jgi:hypothetical protein
VSRAFALPKPVLAGYGVVALFLAATLVSQAARRGPAELAGWVTAAAAMVALALARPAAAPLAAGFAAFLLGFARTWKHGPNLDLGLALVLIAVGAAALRDARARERPSTDVAGLLLLALAGTGLVSLAFAVARVRTFAPAPGFAYREFRYSPLGLSSEEALLRAVVGAASVFAWFGLYDWARRFAPRPGRLRLAILAALAVNSAALLVQRHLEPTFLHPAGLELIDRLNGVTSFCYALGDAALALFLLLPVWGARRGWPAAATALAVGLLVHGAYASGSRTALFVMLGVSVAWGAAAAIRLARAGRRAPALAAAAAVALLVAGSAAKYRATPADQATPFGRLKEGIERQGVLGHLFATRLSSYPLAFRVIGAYPLCGVGAGLYALEVGKQRALLAPDTAIPDEYLLSSYAANQLLNTAVELGAPAGLALLAALAFAFARAIAARTWAGTVSAIAVAGLLAAFQLGPSLYNSEALVFAWLVVGLAAGSASRPADDTRARPARVAALALGGAVALALAGQALGWRALSIESQWQRLRWRMNLGLLPEQEDGRWTAPEATLSVDTDAPAVLVRWHVGDPSEPAYRAEVTFYVDGREVERTAARPGVVRESRLPLPPVHGWKRLSVRVSPPFAPERAGDDRRLGLFVHSVTPLASAPPAP